MKKQEIMKLTSQQVDDELFREMSCSWEKKDLIKHIIGNMNTDNKRDWIKEWFNN